MPAITGSATPKAETTPTPGAVHPRLARLLRFFSPLRREALPTLKYLTQTEVHTYAFSVAANAILSFFPFCVLLLTLLRSVFHSQRTFDALVQLLSAILPTKQAFITSNLAALANAHGSVQLLSVVMLLITSTGVFLPLEVALNRVWGFPKNRSYLGNQIISLLLAAACGVLALVSAALAAANWRFLGLLYSGDGTSTFGKVIMFIQAAVGFFVVQVLATAAIIAIFFLIYWRLPNGKVSARRVLPAAIVTGVLWEVGKHLYMLVLPWLNFREAYGPFYISVTLIFWAFLSGMLLLAGARLSAALRMEEAKPEPATAARDKPAFPDYLGGASQPFSNTGKTAQ